MSTERDAIQARTRSDGLRLLRTINDTQAHGQEGARAYPPRAAQEAGLEVGSKRYEDVRDQHLRGYGLYIFTKRALKLLDALYSPE